MGLKGIAPSPFRFGGERTCYYATNPTNTILPVSVAPSMEIFNYTFAIFDKEPDVLYEHICPIQSKTEHNTYDYTYYGIVWYCKCDCINHIVFPL